MEMQFLVSSCNPGFLSLLIRSILADVLSCEDYAVSLIVL